MASLPCVKLTRVTSWHSAGDWLHLEGPEASATCLGRWQAWLGCFPFREVPGPLHQASQARCSDFLGNGAGLQEVKAEARSSIDSLPQSSFSLLSTGQPEPRGAVGGGQTAPPLLRKPVKEFAPISILSYPIMLSLSVCLYIKSIFSKYLRAAHVILLWVPYSLTN